MKTKVKTIKRKLEQLQKQPKISQCEIARISGIHRSTLNLWLNGQATMRPAQISAVESAIRNLASRRLQSILKDLVPKTKLKSVHNLVEENHSMDLETNNLPMLPETKTNPTPAPAVSSTGDSPEFHRPHSGSAKHPTGTPC